MLVAASLVVLESLGGGAGVVSSVGESGEGAVGPPGATGGKASVLMSLEERGG